MGVRAINGLLTVGEGQRVAIIAGSGVGKSVLMGQMIAGTECDVIVVGLIGERSREVSDFVETKLPPRSDEHTSELQSLMRTSYAVFCLNNKIKPQCFSHSQHSTCYS